MDIESLDARIATIAELLDAYADMGITDGERVDELHMEMIELSEEREELLRAEEGHEDEY